MQGWSGCAWRAGSAHWDGLGFVGATTASLCQPPPDGYLSTGTRPQVRSRAGLLLRPLTQKVLSVR